MKRAIVVTFALILPMLVGACNTMQGAGEDLSAGGHAITNSADKNKDY